MLMRERYEIRIHGLFGPLLRSRFASLACETMPRQSTIRGRFSEEELEQLLDRLEESGVELVHLDAG
ncbi:hypothetical protein [Actinoplanes subtropicus]|uniref:hypothetical protein n=1 Tax=Actinoplanes subtropicus TaxID=543632 RepID=UPI0004C41D97|nr:hypothetical protein [Actinoplanes subtropicus]